MREHDSCCSALLRAHGKARGTGLAPALPSMSSLPDALWAEIFRFASADSVAAAVTVARVPLSALRLLAPKLAECGEGAAAYLRSPAGYERYLTSADVYAAERLFRHDAEVAESGGCRWRVGIHSGFMEVLETCTF